MTVLRGGRYAAGLVVLTLSACSSDPAVTGSRVTPQRPTTGTGAAGTAAAGSAAIPGGQVGSTNDPSRGLINTPQMTANGGAAGAQLRDGQCARGDIVAQRVVPTIWLVIDGSGSMVQALGDSSRWDALRGALMDPAAGVVKQLEHEVSWGMIMYDGPGGGPQPLPDGGIAMFSTPPADTCPRLVSVEPAKDNFMAIDAMYPKEPLGGSTPTHKAIQAVVGHLPQGGMQQLDTHVNPTIVVLATDGAPNDFCSMAFFPPDPSPEVIQGVQQLAQNEVKTYVISLAGDDQNLTQHLTQVAAAGGTMKPPFLPTDKDSLVQAFKDIIGPETSCDVVLNGKVKPGIECMGKIEINGVQLGCNDPNGWMLKDPSTVTIQGTACQMYKMDQSSVLHADFPCEAIALN